MGFPEVILPGDVRNDLYLTLIGGEFSKGNKTSEKNVEVTVYVCNDKGQTIPVSVIQFCYRCSFKIHIEHFSSDSTKKFYYF